MSKINEYIKTLLNGLSFNGVFDKPEIPEQVQPDWNQNDETAPDYVKNRPFYSSKNVKINKLLEETIFNAESSETTEKGNLYYDAECAVSIDFYNTGNIKYIVVLDGKTYEDFPLEERYLGAGNYSYVIGDATDEYPFYYDSRIYFKYAGEHRLSILQSIASESTMQIPRKYIPTTDFVDNTSNIPTSYAVTNYISGLKTREIQFRISTDEVITNMRYSDIRDLINQGTHVYLFNLDNYCVYQLFSIYPDGLIFANFADSGNGTTYGYVSVEFVTLTATKNTFTVDTIHTDPKRIYIESITSSKRFKITVDDSGKPTFTNSSDSADSYTPTDLPSVTASDSGKFLCVSSEGKWVAKAIPNASGVSF